MSAHWYGPLLSHAALAEAIEVHVTGLQLDLGLGSVSEGVLLSGSELTLFLGEVTISSGVQVELIGLELDMELGLIGRTGSEVSGMLLNMGLGSVTVTEGFGATVNVTGLELVMSLNGLKSWTDIPNSQATNWIEIR